MLYSKAKRAPGMLYHPGSDQNLVSDQDEAFHEPPRPHENQISRSRLQIRSQGQTNITVLFLHNTQMQRTRGICAAKF